MGSGLTRRDFLRWTALGAAAGAAAMGAPGMARAQEGAKPRNIVFILTDDQRFDAMSAKGHPFLKTPHLDNLLANGVDCENTFVTTSLCSPSRATILTSTYAHVHGVLDNGTRLNPEMPTFPKLLQDAGYKTGFVGKWHMGGSSDDPRPGFDRWVSFRGQGVYRNPKFNVDGEQVDLEGHTSDLITDYAVDFLKDNQDGPYMLYMSHKAVHAMFEPAERHEGVYEDEQYPHPASMADTPENYEGKPDWVKEQRDSWHGVDGMCNEMVDFDKFTRDYCETMLSVDDSVGKIVETLDELGQLDSTLLVFTSDNGFLFGEHGLIDKRCMYEPSIRVPLIAHCPELFGTGKTCERLITNLDFAPTFLEAAGVPIPESMQGSSFLQLLQGKDVEWREAFLYEYFWERSFPQTPSVLGVRGDRYKFMQYHGVWDYYELYDLKEDPHEMNNLLGGYIQTTEAGTLDRLLAFKIEDREVKKIYNEMRGQLMRLIDETGCRPEPVW